ncbi:MAG: carbamoyltransferase HypF [Prochlorococcaceae cyanobacterium]
MSQARLRLHCRGVVQGVGFRPLVHRLASELQLVGEVENVAGAVRLELQGERRSLELLVRRLPEALQSPGSLEPLQPEWLPPLAPAPAGLRIAAAAAQPLGSGLVATALAADLAPCPACRAELGDPANRRHQYPFISCSQCGPRYSIATAEPYARAHTTLAGFPLCAACQREFDDPTDRRFHAETIGCPSCGPQLQLLDGAGCPRPGEPLAAAVAALRAGAIVALQGVGGFQLLVNAANPKAVAKLRQRKRRPHKPFALLLDGPERLAELLQPSAAEREALWDPAAPIVLLASPAPAHERLLAGVAAGAPGLGVMLPASALHLLLAEAFAGPLVATSGNRSGEPLCIDPAEALERLGGIADAYLVHNRPIARPLDDSVLQLIEGRRCLIRRARGYAPQALPLARPFRADGPALLALGGDLKSAPALVLGDRLHAAPHLGNLAEPQVLRRWQQGLAELEERWGDRLVALACDGHPGYLSHQQAQGRSLPCSAVPHHLAHALAVAAEHGLAPPLLAFAADGLGYGEEQGSKAGQELLRGAELLWLEARAEAAAAASEDAGGNFNTEQQPGLGQRLAALRPFPLPGGERASREPRRCALGLLHAAGLLDHPGAAAVRAAFPAADLALLRQALATGCNSPACSSLGRLFDAVASLLDLAQRLSYEGEGGLRVEGAAAQAPAGVVGYPLPLLPADLPLGRLHWQPLLEALLADRAAGASAPHCAARFQAGISAGLAEAIAAAARRSGCRRVLLGGGCFQNRALLQGCLVALRQRGLEPFHAEALPSGDGGLALGQALAVTLSTGPDTAANEWV